MGNYGCCLINTYLSTLAQFGSAQVAQLSMAAMAQLGVAYSAAANALETKRRTADDGRIHGVVGGYHLIYYRTQRKPTWQTLVSGVAEAVLPTRNP